MLVRTTKYFLHTKINCVHKPCYVDSRKRSLSQGAVLTQHCTDASHQTGKLLRAQGPFKKLTAHLQSLCWENSAYTWFIQNCNFRSTWLNTFPAFHFQRTWFNSCLDNSVCSWYWNVKITCVSDTAAANREGGRNVLPLGISGIQGSTTSCLYFC